MSTLVQETPSQKNSDGPEEKGPTHKDIMPFTIEDELVDISDLWKGPNGSFVSGKRFDYLTRLGCAACSGNIDQSDHLDVKWLAEDTVLCPQCAIRHENGAIIQ